jgi:hypothetical protein
MQLLSGGALAFAIWTSAEDKLMSTAIPEAHCVLERDRMGQYWQWVVHDCPYCHRQHRHGAGRVDKADPRKHLDVRVAYCRQDSAYTYQLVELE